MLIYLYIPTHQAPGAPVSFATPVQQFQPPVPVPTQNVSGSVSYGGMTTTPMSVVNPGSTSEWTVLDRGG
jgi:hypothetical protein